MSRPNEHEPEDSEEPAHDEHPAERAKRQHASWHDLVVHYPWLPAVAGLVLAGLCVWLFAEIAEQVYQGGVILELDRRLLEIVATFRTPLLVSIFGIVTYLGEGFVVVAVVVIAGGVLGWMTRSWVPALLLALSSVGTSVTVFLVKLTIARPRPIPAPNAATEDGFAFPSGHSAHSAAVYLMVAILLVGFLHTRLSRVFVIVTAFLLVLATGFSRLILGVHSPSDVLAGWLLGISFTLVVVSLWQLSQYLPRIRTALVQRAQRRQTGEDH